MKFHLDTNICIYFLKGKSSELCDKLLSKHPDEIKIPSIVKAELYYGALKSRQSKTNIEIIEKFLLPYEIVGFGSDASIKYGEIRAKLEKEGKIIGPNDLIVASTVLANNGALVTNNQKEFSRVPSLKIENWLKS